MKHTIKMSYCLNRSLDNIFSYTLTFFFFHLVHLKNYIDDSLSYLFSVRFKTSSKFILMIFLFVFQVSQMHQCTYAEVRHIIISYSLYFSRHLSAMTMNKCSICTHCYRKMYLWGIDSSSRGDNKIILLPF